MHAKMAMDAIQRFVEANCTTIAGSTFLICSLLCVLPYILVTRLFVSEKDFQAITAYNIMLCIGVCDIVQLFCHIITAIFVFFQSTLLLIINKIIGGLANSCWIAMIALNLVLAFNRFSVLCWAPRFAGRHFFMALCGICFLWGALFFASYMTPYVGITFAPDMFTWSYDGSKYSDVVSTIEFVGSNAHLFTTFCTYICIVVHVISERKKVHGNQSQRKHELWLLVQSIIMFSYCALLIFAWHYYYLFLPSTKWTYASINTLWILSGGLNPLLYLSMNRTIRLRFIRVYFCCCTQSNNDVGPFDRRQDKTRSRSTPWQS